MSHKFAANRCVNHFCDKNSGHFSLPISTTPQDTGESFRWSSNQADVLSDQLDTSILVTGLLLSPIYSITALRSNAFTPVLRTTGHLACLIDVVGLLTSLALRMRLKLLHRDTRGRSERFAQAVHLQWSKRAVTAIPPIVLIASSVLLFLIVLSGSLFTATSAEAVPYNTYELAIVGSALALSAVQISSVAKMCLTLG